jgi:adenylosuccinate lyase
LTRAAGAAIIASAQDGEAKGARPVIEKRDSYENPLVARYASREMVHLFSPEFKFRTWRRLWIALAEAERELGLPVSAAQVAQLRRHADDINYAVAEKLERELRHDVMSHVKAYGRQCPKAAPIIHLGATSCYVTDNADLIVLREALKLVLARARLAAEELADFCRRWRKLPALGLTHLQPAQLVTVGKRATLWLQELLLDAAELERRLELMPFHGVKGATGTQVSFLHLFGGDGRKVRKLEGLVARKMGFDRVVPVSGQTYSRKLDSQVLYALMGLAESAAKFGNDLRILASRKELEEPFESKQIGSSAMAYKRNPMRAERMVGLSRYLLAAAAAAPQTAATQWMERTLDDSAPRRMYLPECFLAADAILILWANVAGGLVVYPKVIRRNIEQELPFMATEEILMAAVKAGGDRQELHEVIRRHSQAAARRVKAEGLDNDLMARLAADPAFAKVRSTLAGSLRPEKFIGRAPEQVDEFLRDVARPALARLRRYRVERAQVRV